MNSKLIKVKIDWFKVAEIINKKIPRIMPYTPGYLYNVYKGYSANKKVREEIFKILGKKRKVIRLYSA
jgi:hypothetical protein